MNTTLDYEEVLASPRWKNIGRALRDFHCGCQACGATTRTDVHHAHYDTLGAERPTDLVLLCRECHDAVHDNDWPAEEVDELRMENPTNLW